jgi:hypothetical protein
MRLKDMEKWVTAAHKYWQSIQNYIHPMTKLFSIRFAGLINLICIVAMLLSTCGLLPKATQQQIEATMGGYPKANGLQRTTKAVDSDEGIWITFTTNDPKEQVLTYYDQQLRNLGFRDSRSPYSLEQFHFDKSYVIRDCPQYGAEVKVDSTTKQVTVLLIISECR